MQVSKYLKKSSLQDRRMCQYSRNNSIQSSSWTMIPLSWFPNFHICEFGHRRLSLVILVSGAELIAWFCLCAQDSIWMNHILHMSKWQKYSWFPGRPLLLLIMILLGYKVSCWVSKWFPISQTSSPRPESNKNVLMLLFSLEHHLFATRKNLIEQSQFFAPASIFSSILSKH